MFKMHKWWITIIMIGFTLVIMVACSSIPPNTHPVKKFDLNRYLGAWYEIARLDSRFEKDLNNVSAQYSLNTDRNVVVLNSGYNTVKKEWVKADGLAKFRGNQSEAALKVSFFGPFYAGYNVVALDTNYRYALVAGKDLNYLWILSRDKTIPEDVKTNYLKIALEIGYNTSKLIWVKHDRKDNPFLPQ